MIKVTEKELQSLAEDQRIMETYFMFADSHLFVTFEDGTCVVISTPNEDALVVEVCE